MFSDLSMEEFLERMGQRFVSPRPGFTERLWSRIRRRSMQKILGYLVDEGDAVTIIGPQRIPNAMLSTDKYDATIFHYEGRAKEGSFYQTAGGHFHVRDVEHIVFKSDDDVEIEFGTF